MAVSSVSTSRLHGKTYGKCTHREHHKGDQTSHIDVTDLANNNAQRETSPRSRIPCAGMQLTAHRCNGAAFYIIANTRVTGRNRRVVCAGTIRVTDLARKESDNAHRDKEKERRRSRCRFMRTDVITITTRETTVIAILLPVTRFRARSPRSCSIDFDSRSIRNACPAKRTWRNARQPARRKEEWPPSEPASDAVGNVARCRTVRPPRSAR